MPTPTSVPSAIDALTAEVEALLSEIENDGALFPGHSERILALLGVADGKGFGFKLTARRLRERLEVLRKRVTSTPASPNPRRLRHA